MGEQAKHLAQVTGRSVEQCLAALDGHDGSLDEVAVQLLSLPAEEDIPVIAHDSTCLQSQAAELPNEDVLSAVIRDDGTSPTCAARLGTFDLTEQPVPEEEES